MEFLPTQLAEFIDIAWGWIGSFVPFVVIGYVFTQFKKKEGLLSTSQEILSYSYWKDRDVSAIAKDFWSGLSNNNKILLVVFLIMNPLIGIVYGFHLFSRYSKKFVDKEENTISPENSKEDENSIHIQEEDQHSLSPKREKATRSHKPRTDPGFENIAPDVSEDDNPPLFS